MSTRLNLAMAFVVVLGVLAMISGPVSACDLAPAVTAGQAPEMYDATDVLGPNRVLDENVAILSLSTRSTQMTNTESTLYAKPDAGSNNLCSLMPGTEVMVAGYNATHTFAAITDIRNGMQLYGWMATSQLKVNKLEMQVSGVTRVYSEPSVSSAKVDELGPYDMVDVLGMSPNGAWVAVDGQGMDRDQIGWIQSNMLRSLDR